MKRKVLLTVIVIIMGLMTQAQISGTFTIPGGTYPTIGSAIAAINAQGVGTGGVTFNVTAGYSETFATSLDGVITTTTSSATSPIIFQKSGTGANPTVIAGPGVSTNLTPPDAIFAFGGTDYVTINGINVQENMNNTTNAAKMEVAFFLARASASDGTQHITITNCKISGAFRYYSIYSGTVLLNGTTVTASNFAGTNSYNKITADTIINPGTISMPIFFNGPSNAATTGLYDYGDEIGGDKGNVFINTVGVNVQYVQWAKIASNLFTTQGSPINATPITTQASKSVQIYNNNIGNFTWGSSGTVYIINDQNNLDTVNVYNNNIHDINASAASTFYAIQESSTGKIVKVYGNQVNNITLGTSSTTTGSFSGIYTGTSAAPAGAELDIYNNTMNGNVINNNSATSVNGFIYPGWYGPTIKIYNNTITNNTVNSVGTTSLIYANCLSNNEWYKYIYGNTLTNLTVTGTTGTVTGIYHINSLRTYIYQNKISGITASGPSSIIYGIQFDGGTFGEVYNNYISELYTPTASGTNQVRGIYISAGSSIALHYNTIYLNASSTGANFGSSAIYTVSTPFITLRNNVIDNVSVPSGTGKTIAFWYNGTSYSNYAVASNNNDFYAGTPGANNLIFYNGTIGDQTLTQYQTRLYPAENASFTENPTFVNTTTNPYDLHINTTVNTQLESSGTTITTPSPVTTDFYNTSRYPNTGYPYNPAFFPAHGTDVGAQEFGGIPKVGTPPSVVITPLQNTSSLTARNLTASITDLTGVPTSGAGLPVLYWNKNNGSWNNSTAVFVSGSQYTFSFGAGVSVNDSIKYYIVAQNMNSPINVGSTPPGAFGLTTNPPAAVSPPPALFAYKIIQGACGTLTVGAGGNYPTLTAAINDLNSKELSCPTTLLLTDPVYASETLPITINNIAGMSPVNTLTIKPAPGINTSIQGTNTTAIITFNGANYVTIDGSNNGSTSRNLTVWNSNSSGGEVIFFTSPGDFSKSASNDVIKNCNIRGSYQMTNVTYGIFCNATSGGGYNNLVINNNAVYSANIGIRVCGTSTFPSTNCQVTNNIVGTAVDSTSIALYGIYIVYADNTLVQGNEVMGMGQLGSTNNNLSGIRLYTLATNTKVRRNKVHGWHINPGAGYTGPWGIFFRGEASSVTEISNNVVYDIQGVGGSSSYYSISGIALQNGGNINVWFNSIDLEGNCLLVSQGTSQSGCIVISPAVSSVDIRNNIMKNNLQLSSGTSTTITNYCIFSQGPDYIFTNLNYNDYWCTGVNPFIASDNYKSFPILAGWQAATGQDANSLNIDPQYTSLTNLIPTTTAMPHAGGYMPAVPIDYTGINRTNPPDMGAYEFTTNPLINTLAATGITTSSATLNGNANATGTTFNLFFDWGLTASYGASVTATPASVSGSSTLSMSTNLTGISPNTTYHFRARGVTSGGLIVYGSDMSFTTPPFPPVVVTLPATSVTSNSATLNGTVNPNGPPATVTFDYGLTTAYGSFVTATQSPISGSVALSVNSPLTGLTPNTTYHCRVESTNSGGTSYGNDIVFTTNAILATVVTNNATNIAPTTAQLNGTVNPNYAGTTVSFDWGLTTAYGNSATATPGLVSGNTTTPVLANISGLTWGTTYHFRCVGVNLAGTAYGSDLSFNTNCPVPAAPGTITGITTVCQNQSGVTYSVPAILNATNYNWTVPTGSTVVSGSGTNTITVNYSTTAVSGNITVTGTNSCATGPTGTLAITVNPMPVPTISGSATACAGYTNNVYTTQSGMTAYNWTVSTGGIITAGPGTSSITVTWNTTGAKTVTVNYANANGCTAASPATFNVTVNALPAPTITGNTNLCAGSGYYTYTTETGMTGYNWTITSGGSIYAGAGTAAITVVWNNAGAQTVSVNYSNANSCQALNPTVLNVTVNGIPAAAGSINGTSTVCAGQQGIPYSVGVIAGAQTYVWTLPTGATIASGAGTNIISVDFASGAVSGPITVFGNNICGNGATSPALNVTVTPLPAAAGTISGPTAVCQGENGVVYTVPAITNATGYTWTVPAGATITSGANTSSIHVDFSSSASSGSVTVLGTNACGNGTSSGLSVTVSSVPPTPTITANGYVLTSSAANGNQWYHDGSAVAGATGQTYTVPAAAPGWYWTVVTLGACSSDSSNHKYIQGVGIGEHHEDQVKIYPVPNDGHFNISISSEREISYKLEIYNCLGVKIYGDHTITVNGTLITPIDLGSVASGLYTIVLRNTDNQVIRKILINK